MPILRNRSQQGFTLVDNYALNDKRLSLKSVGLLVKMLSLPDCWEFSEAGLMKIVKDGQSSIRSGLKELEECGYLVRTRLRDEKGRIKGYDWEVFTIPYGKPRFENHSLGIHNLETADNKELKEESTKESITKIEKKYPYGEYANVMLSDSDISKLQADFPEDWEQRIERLSEYISSSGKKYKSHLATIRSWSRNDEQKKPQARKRTPEEVALEHGWTVERAKELMKRYPELRTAND